MVVLGRDHYAGALNALKQFEQIEKCRFNSWGYVRFSENFQKRLKVFGAVAPLAVIKNATNVCDQDTGFDLGWSRSEAQGPKRTRERVGA
jgi:hypothetical protein